MGDIKTILYVNHTAKMGGGEIALLNFVSVLDRVRFRPLVVLASEGPLAARLRDAGVETILLPLDSDIVNTRKDSLGGGSALRLRQIVSLLRYAARLARLARAQQAALIHTNSLKAAIYGGLAGKIARIPVAWHVRDGIDQGYLPRAAVLAVRALARWLPQVVIANSKSTLARLRNSEKEASSAAAVSVAAVQDYVVHDGVNLAQFGDWLPELAALVPPQPAAPVITLVGRITPWKGQHVFLRAAAQVIGRVPDARFWIVGAPLFGEDDYARQLHELAEALGISGRVEFTGQSDFVPTLLALSDIVVHASTIGEPFGQVVIEGMAAGKPVIATRGGALPEIVEDGVSGCLVPMGDAEAMAQAILELLSDPKRAAQMGEAARSRVQKLFTITRTARSIEAIYEALLQLPSSRKRYDFQQKVPFFMAYGRRKAEIAGQCEKE